MRLKRDLTGHGQFNLRSSSCTAPYPELRPDLFRSLAHTGKTPVPIASCAQHLRIDAASVVTDENAKVAGRIVNLNLNLACARVAERIDQGFAANAAHLVANPGMQCSGQALHDDAKVNFLRNDKFLSNVGKRLPEIACIIMPGTQTTHGIAPSLHDSAHECENPGHQRFRR